jgi:tetratricopeptide (TPR) repeat protein
MVHKRTRGNPYYIEEIVSYLVTRNVLIQDGSGLWNYNPNGTADVLPPSLMQAFSLRMEKLAESRRIEDLTETSRQALAAAATIGAEFDVEIWTATLELDDGDQAAVALATLEEAMALRLVRQTGEKSFMFDPVDIADVLFSSQPETRQRKLHRQIAEVLSQKGTDPIDVSHHYQQAGLTAQAAHYLERAGVKAMADEAIDEAITYFDRALVLMESLTGYETLGSLYRQKGALAASTRAFEQALKLAEHARDTVGKARILNELTRVSLMNNLYDDARQAAATVLTLQGVSGADRATAEFHLGKISWVTGHLSQAEDWCRRSLETFEATRDQVRFATVSNQLGLIYFSRGRLAEATQAINRSLGIHITLKDFTGQAYCLNNLGRIAIDEGKFDQAQAQLAEAQQLFEAADYARGLMLVFTNQGRVLLRQDRSGQALPVLRKALEQAKKLRPPTAYHLADMYLVVAQANLKRGNLSQAKASTEDALSLLQVTGNQDYVAAGQATLAQINAAEGETSTANTLFQRAIEQHNKAGNPTALLDTRLKYAHFLAEQDRVKEAEALEQAAREEAGRLGISW